MRTLAAKVPDPQFLLMMKCIEDEELQLMIEEVDVTSIYSDALDL